MIARNEVADFVCNHTRVPAHVSSLVEQFTAQGRVAVQMLAQSNEPLGRLRGRVHRMEAMIDGILEYSRIGRVRVEPEGGATPSICDEVKLEVSAPPQVTSVARKPLSIAFEEIAADKIVPIYGEELAAKGIQTGTPVSGGGITIPDSLRFEPDPTLPLDRARTIPNTWYTRPEIAESERAAVFGGTWQVVGRAGRVHGGLAGADVGADPGPVDRDRQRPQAA